MMHQNNTCPAIAHYLDLPEIRQISARYGTHWQRLSRICKWALLGVLGFEAALYLSEGFSKSPGMTDILEGIEPVLEGLCLTPTEIGDVRYIIGELAEIDETQQAQLVSALATTIAAGIYSENFSDLFAEA